MKKSLMLAAVIALAAAAFSVPAFASPPGQVLATSPAGAAAVDVGLQSAAATKEINRMSTTMRAKLQVSMVQEHRTEYDAQNNKLPAGETRKYQETLSMHAVAAKGYPADGSDEDNTYAKWSPGASLTINIANPNLWGKFKHGDKFYVDFTPADPPAA